ncbi:MAG: flagellar basal body-associated protein FliL [Pseudomonadota bacterium]
MMKLSRGYLAFVRQSCCFYMLVLLLALVFNPTVKAEEAEESRPNYAYLALEPDIVTNYVNNNASRLGFVRMTVEVMLEDADNIPTIEHHMPLLRAIVIEIVGAQSESKVRSMSGREEIRREILSQFKDVMIRETGTETVRDVIFTKYLRQGG